MIGAFALETTREQSRVPAIGAHPPDGRRTAGLSAAEDDLTTIGRFARAKIPDRRVALRQARHGAILWIEAANFRAAAGQFRFKVAVEVVAIGTLRLEFPCDLRARKLPREQDVTVARPSRHV